MWYHLLQCCRCKWALSSLLPEHLSPNLPLNEHLKYRTPFRMLFLPVALLGRFPSLFVLLSAEEKVMGNFEFYSCLQSWNKGETFKHSLFFRQQCPTCSSASCLKKRQFPPTRVERFPHSLAGLTPLLLIFLCFFWCVFVEFSFASKASYT